MLPVVGPRSVSVRMRDGTRLDADVWSPGAPGRVPVLLMRQPYGRRIASTLVYAHPAWYAAQGYLVVVQDVRGTGSSEGRFRIFEHEAADGAETAAWAANLPGSNGRVGTYGFSYQGNTQFLAIAGGARLAAAAPAMAGWDLRSDWAWEGGAFRLGPNLGWGAQIGWLRARHNGDDAVAAAFQAAARTPPLGEPHRTLPAVMRQHGALTHYPDWLAHPEPGPFWDAVAPRALLAPPPAVPMLHVGGWYDQMLMGTLEGHAALAAGGAPQRLVVGPWQHQPWGRRVGAVDMGPQASSPVDLMQLAWFDRHLKDRESDTGAPLTLFDLGARRWRDFAGWPETAPRILHLGSTGRAAATTTDGVLRPDPGPPGTDRLVHDPWRPVPVMGGHGGAPGGMQDRAAVDDRADVACYTGAALAAPLLLCGRVAAELRVEADQPSFDLSAVLAMVAPDGRVWNMTQGHLRVDGAPGQVRVEMRAVCATVPAGHALRLSLAGACFPAYAMNPGSGAPAAGFTAGEERIITLALHHGGDARSWLMLPEVR